MAMLSLECVIANKVRHKASQSFTERVDLPSVGAATSNKLLQFSCVTLIWPCGNAWVLSSHPLPPSHHVRLLLLPFWCLF